MKKQVWFLKGLLMFLIAVGIALYTQRVEIGDFWRELTAPELPEAVGFQEVESEKEEVGRPDEAEPNEEAIPSEEIASSPEAPRNDDGELPSSFNLAVPFTSQAPFANWDAVHGETCEEASVYMVAEYYSGTTGAIAPQTAEDELQRLVALQTELFGYFEDTTAEETARLATAAYGFRAEVEANPTVELIKAHIAAGRPVIVPAAGRLLGNPYFTPPGPDYHMLVIRGYTEDSFITNDPGTRRGEEFVYPYDRLLNAVHDWTGDGATIESGARVGIVIYPK